MGIAGIFPDDFQNVLFFRNFRFSENVVFETFRTVTMDFDWWDVPCPLYSVPETFVIQSGDIRVSPFVHGAKQKMKTNAHERRNHSVF